MREIFSIAYDFGYKMAIQDAEKAINPTFGSRRKMMAREDVARAVGALQPVAQKS